MLRWSAQGFERFRYVSHYRRGHIIIHIEQMTTKLSILIERLKKDDKYI